MEPLSLRIEDNTKWSKVFCKRKEKSRIVLKGRHVLLDSIDRLRAFVRAISSFSTTTRIAFVDPEFFHINVSSDFILDQNAWCS